MSWEWQRVKLYFSDTKVRQNYTSYPYTYDAATATGTAGEIKDSNGGEWNRLGGFSISSG